MFWLGADIHLSDIGCLYRDKLQRDAGCRILRMSVNRASTMFSFVFWVIDVLIGRRNSFIQYWQPLLAKTTATCSLPAGHCYWHYTILWPKFFHITFCIKLRLLPSLFRVFCWQSMSTNGSLQIIANIASVESLYSAQESRNASFGSFNRCSEITTSTVSCCGTKTKTCHTQHGYGYSPVQWPIARPPPLYNYSPFNMTPSSQTSTRAR